MTNYIKTFSDETAYEQFTESSGYVTPNVSYCSGGSNSLFFNPLKHDYSKDYFTIVALEDGQFKLTGIGCGAAPMGSHYYSIDNGQTWTELSFDTNTPTISAGTKILWKNNMPTGYMVGTFVSTGSFDVEGNIMSLVYGDNFEGQTSLQGYSHPFWALFQGCNVINANNLSLPATTLANHCYDSMFNECTGLTTAPELPATTLADSCYNTMFSNCTSLTSAPALPAMTLAYFCYAYMFYDCRSLTTAPELPATTLASRCYYDMFLGCTSLTSAPELPATELADSCYSGMFYGCSGLTTAPVLSATTLANYCYWKMLSGCTRLNSITCLATNISASNCTSNWVSGVASSGTFTKAASMSSWTTGVDGIPSGWTVVDKQ